MPAAGMRNIGAMEVGPEGDRIDAVHARLRSVVQFSSSKSV
ncbi:hypothetical protein K788_0002390 [Paraburkholderia caribensis MBA4]|uniref:Uncharacterized protein n=1 Tax=Paraburkholderia caribensis MBA4 TaxID=1323664 RepID=A0A0P0R9S8_9BURK|nr:hypothetical protein K788_0002390 [Paraburkholderia caribensis MBA4]